MISFVMLTAKDMEKTADVFRAAGLEFAPEQHGTGPEHLASTNTSLVVEIYPGLVQSAGTMIGVEAQDLNAAAKNCQRLSVEIEKGIAPFGETRRMILKTPEDARLFVQETGAT